MARNIKRADGTTIDLELQEAEQANTDAGAKKVITMDGYIQRMAYTGAGLPEYIGLASPGTATSAASWQIRKLTYSGTNVTELNFADGNLNFDNVWDDHATLSYS